MARAIWSGTLNFGLVTVPVQLFNATEDHTIHFRQLQRGTCDRIRYRRVNERTGEEVPFDEVVKGYDLGGDEYVVIEPHELAEIAPGRSRTIDIETFVELDEIDPVYFRKTYWLAPPRAEFDHAYSLLIEAMATTNRAGIARFVMRGREYIGAVRAGNKVLVLDTLLFREEIREPEREIGRLPELGRARAKEIDMAVSLIESMAERWRPEDYHDTYTERVMQLIEDKRAGRTATPAEQPPEATETANLFEALSRSVESRRRTGKNQPVEAAAPAPEGQPPESPDWTRLSKTELEGMARDLAIKGRSKMNRSQLEQAITDAWHKSARRSTGATTFPR